MRLAEYWKLRSAVQMNVRPGEAAEKRAAVERLAEALQASPIFEDVEVETTENNDSLVIAMCRFAAHLSEREAANALADLWEERLRYGYWGAHTTLADQDQVELQGATCSGLNGHYLTLHVVAQRGAHVVPPQRADGGDADRTLVAVATPAPAEEQAQEKRSRRSARSFLRR